MVSSPFTPREHAWPKKIWRGLTYNLHTYVFKRPDLTADIPWLSAALRASSEDMLARRLYKTAHYEPGVTDFLVRYLSSAPQDVIFDVGANVGYYSVLAHRICGDNVPVHAVEAERDNHRQLLHNLKQNATRSVVPHFCAISDAPGALELYLWKRSNRGKHSLVPFEGADTVTVEAKTLAQLYQEQQLEGRTISLLKIDIEGAEHRAFLGAGDVLSRCAVITSEVSPKFLRRAGVDLDEHLQVVCDRGFTLFEIHDDKRVTPCSPEQLRDSPKGRNVAYVRDDLLRAPWAAALLAE